MKRRRTTDLVPRSVKLDYRCALYEDGAMLLFEVSEYEDGTVTFELTGGQFGLAMRVPSRRDTNHEATDARISTWERHKTVGRSIARSIVAFGAFVAQRYPWVKRIRYSNKATVDLDVDVLHDKWHKAAEEVLYRVRYYERMGFAFAVPYARQVETVEQDLREGVRERSEVPFKGDLVSMARTVIPAAWPRECGLVSLTVGPCSRWPSEMRSRLLR